ncbi:MAG: glycosyltransferase family 2 protein [Deltaproteobacteria bacterium]
MIKLSVLVPVYNLAPYIGACLDSLVTQEPGFDFEILVGDDASTDGSKAILDEYARRFPRVRVLRAPQNQGLAGNLRRLFDVARGEYLAYLDGDDLALPGKCQIQAEYLDHHPGCAIVYHESEVFDADTGKTLWLYNANYYNHSRIPAHASAADLARFGVFLHAGSVMFRHHAHLADLAENGCRILFDYPMHLYNALYLQGTLDRLDAVLGRYRLHRSNSGAMNLRSLERRGQVLADQLLALDRALALGLDAQAAQEGRWHFQYATALYMLRAGEIQQFLEHLAVSTDGQWFFDDRHRITWQGQQDPLSLQASLFVEETPGISRSIATGCRVWRPTAPTTGTEL